MEKTLAHKTLAHVTVRLQVSDSVNYTVRLQLCRLIRAKYSTVYAPITLEEIVIVMIKKITNDSAQIFKPFQSIYFDPKTTATPSLICVLSWRPLARDDWSALLCFVVEVVKRINVGPEGTHIGDVTFGNISKLIFDEFNKTTDYEMRICNEIESIPRPSSDERAFINRGLRLANRRVMREEFGMRPDATQVRSFL